MPKELEATEILQTNFVSNVSHEFKTPITAIEGYATLLGDSEGTTPQQKEYIEKILLNTGRLSTLVGNILLLSKIDNQSIETKQEEFSLDEQIRRSILLLELKWTEKNVEMDVDLQSIRYIGNPSLLMHVWNNLIGNAIKFTPEGSTVSIRLLESGKEIIFTVEDQGRGVSEDAKKHIFEKFYQGDSSHRQEGNGLGLALVKSIVDTVNGRISVENLEKGCRFNVTLPQYSHE
jgi:signal transduction histidine kinase